MINLVQCSQIILLLIYREGYIGWKKEPKHKNKKESKLLQRMALPKTDLFGYISEECTPKYRRLFLYLVKSLLGLTCEILTNAAKH